MKTKALPYLLLLLATNVFGQALQLSIAIEDTAAIFPVSRQVSALASGGFISTTSRDVAGLTPIWTKHQADGSVVWHRALQREDSTFRFGVNRILALPDGGMIALLPRLDDVSRTVGAILLRLDAAVAPGLTVTRLQIFNRWGGLVFDQSGEAPAWDGTFLGQPAPTGLYVYRLTYTRLSDGTAGQEEGEVVLLR